MFLWKSFFFCPLELLPESSFYPQTSKLDKMSSLNYQNRLNYLLPQLQMVFNVFLSF